MSTPPAGPAVQVLPVPEGSIVVFRNIGLGLDGEGEDRAMTVLREAVGHSRFCVVHIDSAGDVVTWGPDDDLATKVLDLIEATVPARSPGRDGTDWPGSG